MEGHIGRLYGLNTLGAVAGSFGAGFLLMPNLGMRGSNMAAAGLGLAVAVAAFAVHLALGRRAESSPEWRPASAPASGQGIAAAQGSATGGWLLFAFALSGFAALAYEVLWSMVRILTSRLRETNEKLAFLSTASKFG